jgi:hypothetical protein
VLTSAGRGLCSSAWVKNRRVASVSRGPANWSVNHTPSTTKFPPNVSEISQRPAATARRTARSRWLSGVTVVAFLAVLLPFLHYLDDVVWCSSNRCRMRRHHKQDHPGGPQKVWW